MAVDLAFVLAFAFGAGMVAFFSPCCAAMLPAYVSYALTRAEAGAPAAAAVPHSRRQREFGALALWAGLLVAALGLGRLALEAVASFGGIAPPTSTGDREWSVGLATVGILVALAGTYMTADPARLRRGLRFGALATLGFLAIFTLIGLPIALFARELVPALGYAAVVMGIALIALGIYTLSGRHITLPIRLFSPKAEGPGGFFVFGIAYGLASISCTFPIFLVVVALALVSGGFGAAVLAFAAYALGKGAVLTLVTVLSTSSPAAVEGRIRRALPMFDKAMAVVLVAAGAFIAYYFGVLYAPA